MANEKNESGAASRQPAAGNRQYVIGLTGLVCAGKSTVAVVFRKHGARVFDADRAVHDLYRQPEVIRRVREMFGPEVLDAKGEVSRAVLGAVVFADPAQLKRLTNEVVFPRTRALMQAEIQAFAQSGARLLLLDAPTLLEAGSAELCHEIVLVTAPWERRAAWALARGWTADELRRRDSQMMDEAAKRAKATVVLENDGSLAGLEAKTEQLLQRWK